jgi:hypothetical protein
MSRTLGLQLNLERMPNLWYLTSESQTMIFLHQTETIRFINSSKQEPVTDFFGARRSRTQMLRKLDDLKFQSAGSFCLLLRMECCEISVFTR